MLWLWMEKMLRDVGAPLDFTWNIYGIYLKNSNLILSFKTNLIILGLYIRL